MCCPKNSPLGHLPGPCLSSGLTTVTGMISQLHSSLMPLTLHPPFKLAHREACLKSTHIIIKVC